MSNILWFEQVRKQHVGQVGGKGANLGEMLAAGLPVPPGFCITAAAYRAFLQSAQVEARIADYLARLRPDDLENVSANSGAIRGLIRGAVIPPKLREGILSGYRKLGAKLGETSPSVAVRSSATAEDLPSASFAGQQETYLNIRGEDQLLRHVRDCWASLWEDRAVVYREKQGFDHRKVHLCVVVQAMIESEVAGVLFTANPISGSREETVITASWGLGEAVVSGLVTPDTIVVNTHEMRVTSRQMGSKELAIHYGADGGTVEVVTSGDLRQRPAISDEQAIELAALGKRIERQYGVPQDIEWAYSKNKLFALQARPITTLVHAPDEYNRSMFVEIFPDPLSPSFLSVIGPVLKSMLDFTLRYWGFRPPRDREAIGNYYNQPYFNRNYIEQALAALSEGVREPIVARIVNPFGHGAEEARRELSLPYLKMVAATLRFMIRFPKQLPGLLENYRRNVAELKILPLQDLPASELIARVRKLALVDASLLVNYDFLMIAVIGRTYETLGTLLQRSFDQDTQELRAKLISGVTGNVTMETNKRLWDLARIAKSSPEVSRILESSGEGKARKQLEALPEGRAFLVELDQFLRVYGHREVRMDILYPTWGEDPTPILSFIRGYLNSEESQSPHAQQARLSEERQRLSEQALAGIERGALGRYLLSPVFRWVLAQTQLHTRERDTMHFEITRLFPPIRRLLLEVGRRWTSRDLIEAPDDIFFMSLDEMAEVAETARPMQQVVRQRRDEFEQNKRRPWPRVIRGKEEIFAEGVAEQASQNGALQGIAGSPGVVSGPARVIRGPEEFNRLQKGEILVAPLTNPVWTPLFAIAGGVITEVGGILSHGAIVAREYGIPAVMSISGATRIITDGQHIRVDGNRGLVQVEAEAP